MGMRQLGRADRWDSSGKSDRQRRLDRRRQGRSVRQAGGGRGAGDARRIQGRTMDVYFRHRLSAQQQQRGDERKPAGSSSSMDDAGHGQPEAYTVAISAGNRHGLFPSATHPNRRRSLTST